MQRIFFIFLFLPVIAFAQNSRIIDIIPPSPEASSLAKFTEIPVSYYTGLPQIAIPLYKVDLDGLEIPISLSYHARGIAVEEVASHVGIGWTLNAGGAIVRQTRELPDDSSYGYLQDDFYFTFFEDPAIRLGVYNRGLGNTKMVDIQPDRFSFNFLGYSGKFYFDQHTKKIVQEEYSDIKIEPIFENKSNYYKLLGWIITTPDGYKFYFGLPKDHLQVDRIARSIDECINYRFTINNNTKIESEPDNTFNSWQLIDIVSPTGNEVNLNYRMECPIFYRKSFDWIEDDENHDNVCVSYISKVNTKQYQLSSINFEGGTVNFISSYPTEREDLEYSFSLETIEVVNNYNKIIKSFHFEYDYSNDTDTKSVNPTLRNLDPKAAKRLFLNSITEKAGDVSLPPYQFEYYDKDDLPNRFSTSQDYWGYFNGKDNGYFMNFYNAQETSDDKTVDIEKAKTGLISRVIYPTGGYVDYAFEANQAVPPPYFNLLDFNKVNPTIEKNFGFMKNPKDYVSSELYESEEFIIENKISAYINQSFNSWTTGDNRNTAQIITSEGSVVMNLYEGVHDLLANTLVPGAYKIRARTHGFDDPENIENNNFSVTLKWTEEVENQTQITYSGGNRIRKIVLNDTNKGTISKSYEYRYNGNSSGLIYAIPNLEFIRETVGGSEHSGIRPGSPLSYAQGNHVGYSHVTEYINGETEEQGGKVEYQYTCMEDVGKFWIFPYAIPDDNESFRGKPLQVDYYKWDASNEIYKLIKRNNFKYKLFGDREQHPGSPRPPFINKDEPSLLQINEVNDKQKFCIPIVVFISDSVKDNPELEWHNSYKIQYIRGGTMQLIEKQTIDYSGNEITNATEAFKYDNIYHYQIKEKSLTNSNNKTSTTKYYYPSDYLDNYYGYDFPIPNDDLIVPHDIRTYVDNKLVSGQQTKYNYAGQPVEIYQFESEENDIPQRLDKRYTFNSKSKIQYTTTGKIKQVDKTSGETNGIYWGYNNQYSVIVAKNGSYSDIEAALLSYMNAHGVSIEDLLSQVKDIASNSEQQALWSTFCKYIRNHENLKNSQITFYTYRPLVGMTSQKDPNGITTYYEYDDFGRLNIIRDNNGDIINKYDYNYKFRREYPTKK